MPIPLLDFKPHMKEEAKAKTDIATLIENDVMYTSTPDLPRLRYSGPQYLFLWDRMQNMEKWVDSGLDFPNDVRTELFLGKTKNNLMPFRNSANFNGVYESYLPLAPTWVKQMRPMDVGAFTGLEARPIAGKVVSCSLRAIQFFDQYYCNGLVFDRIKMPIVNPNNETTMSCHMYVNKLSSVFKYDPHQQKYKAAFDIDPIPFNTQIYKGVSLFEHYTGVLKTEKEMVS